ncbi:MAG: PEP-CTERM sorting domain-containing protein [Planctomycetia bacterium]
MNDAGTAVQIGTESFRQMSATASTSGTSTYITYLMNASSFSGGNYTGLSLFNGASEEMFIGIPWQVQKFGFDAHGGLGSAAIKVVDFTPLPGTSYLVALGLVPSATPGKVDVKMWATSNLAIDPNTLVAGTPNASLLGSRNDFSFSSIRVAGDYAGTLKVAGIASSPNVSEAASVSVNAVPEPATYAMALAGLVCGGFSMWRRRKRA